MHRLLGINAQILKAHTHRLTTFYDNTFRLMRYSINRRNFLLKITLFEFHRKDTTETASSALFLDIYFWIDINDNHCTRIFGERDDFNCSIANIPHPDIVWRLYNLFIYISYSHITLELEVCYYTINDFGWD